MQSLQAEDPERIGGYVLVGRLGRGAMGTVYLGRSPGGRLVAVKVVHPGLADDPGFRDRFSHEVATARAVGGFWTAAVVDADPAAPRPWLAAEYVPGPTLYEAVSGHGPLPEPALRRLVAGLAEALRAIHRGGLVHRDLKPSNVLLAADGPRVIDFGIAKALEDAQLTATGLVIGTPGFLSPEQIVGRDVTPASDVFALGAVLVYAATGRGPYGTGDVAALVYRAVHTPPRLDGVPPALRPLASRCLHTRPERRPTPDDVLAEVGPPQFAEWLPEPVRADVEERRTEVMRAQPTRQATRPYTMMSATPPSPMPAPPSRTAGLPHAAPQPAALGGTPPRSHSPARPAAAAPLPRPPAPPRVVNGRAGGRQPGTPAPGVPPSVVNGRAGGQQPGTPAPGVPPSVVNGRAGGQQPGAPAPGVPASRVPVPGSPGFGIPGVAAPAALPPGAGSRAVFRTSRTAAAVWGTLTGLGALTCAAISQGASELGDRGGSFVFVVGFLVLAVPAARLLRVLILPRRWIEVAAGGITVGRGSRRRQLTWSQLARVRVVEDRHRPWLVVWPTDPRATRRDLGAEYRDEHGGFRVFPVGHERRRAARHREVRELRAALSWYGPAAYDPGR